MPLLISLILLIAASVLITFPMETMERGFKDNCKSEKLREIILETIGVYPHQYSHQAKHMKQMAESRFGNWWSAVIISERGGYGMSTVYDKYQNTSCEIMIFNTFYWLGRTC
ncbi:hypothetical protein ACQ4LE_008344 [Meloidogyne hapla]